MTATFSDTPPVYSVIRTEQSVNPVYPTQMRKFNLYDVYLLILVDHANFLII